MSDDRKSPEDPRLKIESDPEYETSYDVTAPVDIARDDVVARWLFAKGWIPLEEPFSWSHPDVPNRISQSAAVLIEMVAQTELANLTDVTKLVDAIFGPEGGHKIPDLDPDHIPPIDSKVDPKLKPN